MQNVKRKVLLPFWPFWFSTFVLEFFVCLNELLSVLKIDYVKKLLERVQVDSWFEVLGQQKGMKLGVD